MRTLLPAQCDYLRCGTGGDEVESTVGEGEQRTLRGIAKPDRLFPVLCSKRH